MADWFLETGLYLLGVALVPTAGLLLVCWGLWGDRSKGRARCPRCWYDMRGTVPRLECPECGHDGKHERRLHKNHRRWGRVVVGVVVALLFSYPLVVVGDWCREQVIVHRLTEPGPVTGGSVCVGPDWLVARLPECLARLFDRVVWVRLGASANDADMAECAKLSQLGGLALYGSQVTDAGLAHLKGLPKFERLHLLSVNVTDAGLLHLKDLAQLRQLLLERTQVTNAGVAELRRAWPKAQIMVAGGAPYRPKLEDFVHPAKTPKPTPTGPDSVAQP